MLILHNDLYLGDELSHNHGHDTGSRRWCKITTSTKSQYSQPAVIVDSWLSYSPTD